MDESGPVEIIPADKPNAQQGVRFVYDNGVEVVHQSGNGVLFHGTEGKVLVNRGKFEFFLGSEQKARTTADCDAIAKEYLTDAKVRLYSSNNHGSDWLNSIRTRKPPICDVSVGTHTVIVCHLVNMAYNYNQRLKWNPAKLEFVGGTGDVKWLDVPYRDPWKLA